jgi:hypothetical protein
MRAKRMVRSGAVSATGEHKRQTVRRGARQWAKLIEAQRRSGMKVAHFCRRRRIAKATFWYWSKRLRATSQGQAQAKPEAQFLAVPIMPVADQMEVEVGRLRVRVHGAAAARVLEAIVASIERGT